MDADQFLSCGLTQDRLMAGLDASPACFAVCDEAGRMVFANPAFCELVGRDPDELATLTTHDLVFLGDAEEQDRALGPLLAGTQTTTVVDRRFVRPDATVVTARVKAARLPGEPPQVFLTALDVTEQAQRAELLAYRAAHDEITGLPARALFLDLVDFALQRLRRRPDAVVAVGFIDVDGLKQVNDTYGHAVGDELIAAVPDRLRPALRPSDALARVGGDEFTLLLEWNATAEQERAVSRRLLDALAAPLHLSVGDIAISASLGMVTTNDPDERPDVLVSRADAAMYTAKKRGGNQFAVYDVQADRERIRLSQIEADLRRAMPERQLHLAYQPIIDLRTGTLVAVEALLRWDHPARGPLTAAEFLETAERSGLIIPIGAWVLHEACQQLTRWDDELGQHAPRSVYVNVSARQLGADGLLTSIQDALKASGIDAGRLCLELTETEVLGDPVAAHAMLEQARALGCHLAIDDFGTGYASLSRLTEVNAQTVKLDASFVRQVRHQREAAAVVSATLLLAHNLRQFVVAEGLENGEDLDRLREMGCEYGQGFHIARPMGPDRLSAWALQNVSARA